MNLAPVLIITYNRISHLRQCVSSLAANTLAKDTDLYIAIDYPKNKADAAAHHAIVDYCSTISGFNSVVIFVRDENYGSRRNAHELIDSVFSKYETLIFTEDDNIFHSKALEFINDGLLRYSNDASVFSVSPYNYPIDYNISPDKALHLHAYSAWGVGLWREKFYDVNFSFENLKEIMKSPRKILKMNQSIGEHVLFNAVLGFKSNQVFDDAIISIHQYLHNMTSIFPSTSMVRNIGNDGSGEHCGKSDELNNQKILGEYASALFFDSIEMESNNVRKKLNAYFRLSIKPRVWLWLYIIRNNFN